MSALNVTYLEDWQTGNDNLDRRFMAAMTNKDLEGTMSCFLNSPDMVAVIWGTEIYGPEQLRQAITNVFNKYDEIDLSIDRVREFRSGDAVIAVGQATYAFRQGGTESKLTEVWTDVRRRVNGQWVYVLDHAEVLSK